jgi:hypothetical protein
MFVVSAFEMDFETTHKARLSTSSLDQLGNGVDHVKAIGPLITYQYWIRGKHIPAE